MSDTLRSIAHARTGDKGDTSLLVVSTYLPEDAVELAKALTRQRLAAYFDLREDAVTVHGTALGVYIVVLRGRLSGGVTRSTTLDPHGKTLSGHLLDMPLEVTL